VEPRVVLVTRPTAYDELISAHGTHGQAAWFLGRQHQAIAPLVAAHEAQERAVDVASRSIPTTWRSTRITRHDLDRFLFEPDDIVVAVGQDGLVANIAKYLETQPVIGVNPGGYEGVLVRHPASALAALFPRVAGHEASVEARTRVEAVADDGQRLRALNEIYCGHRTHQSSRYAVAFGQRTEHQSSSGVICATGTGSTGWAKSIARSSHSRLPMPSPTDTALVFFVREAWPSRTTGADLVEGLVTDDSALTLTSEMNVDGVLFGDGIEQDAVAWPFARSIRLGRAPTPLSLVAA
jgi:hypothetical protein